MPNKPPNRPSTIVESEHVCRICASTGPHPQFVVREMMFGTREPFDYFECSNCKTLQIVDVPADLARHYPGDYLGSGFSGDGRRARPAGAALDDLPEASALRLCPAWPKRDRAAALEMAGTAFPLLARLAATRAGRVRARGFSTSAAAPDICWKRSSAKASPASSGRTSSSRVPAGVQVERRPFEELDGSFDLIMLHHSFEHMPDPVLALRALKRLCAPGGTILLRIPAGGLQGVGGLRRELVPDRRAEASRDPFGARPAPRRPAARARHRPRRIRLERDASSVAASSMRMTCRCETPVPSTSIVTPTSSPMNRRPSSVRAPPRPTRPEKAIRPAFT